MTLTAALRASDNPWAKRIVRRNGYRLLVELGPSMGDGAPAQLDEQRARLEDAGIDAFTTLSRGVLSTYGREATLYVRLPAGEVPIAEYTPLYERYAEAAMLARLYVPPERFDEARRVLGVIA